uniref:Ferritin n=1 Tax=Haplochromis burtoni TaxID=8153 RepID=A0A3Q2WSJ5_HAPBU
MSTQSTTLVRQNYHRDCEAAINRMVNMELFASYTYTSMLSCIWILNVLFRFPDF